MKRNNLGNQVVKRAIIVAMSGMLVTTAVLSSPATLVVYAQEDTQEIQLGSTDKEIISVC